MTGEWLRKFCKGMISRGYNKKIRFSCNMRFGALTKKDYQLMAEAGFRFLLFGLESANQKTLEKIGKGIDIDKVEDELHIIKDVNKEVHASLEPHITCMVGYPWETEPDAKNTAFYDEAVF
jgi:anaerobic magnesium-protoporphyrin IX monomethyl ester cyclase